MINTEHINFIQIANNLSVSNDQKFGTYCQPIVFSLLRRIDELLSKAVDITPHSTCHTLIMHREEGPMCCHIGHGMHLIYLSAHDNYWSQWAYQFAHEYCHHLINGELTGQISGLNWFEETICELSSMYILHNLYQEWSVSVNYQMRHFAQAHRDYLDDLLLQNSQLFDSTFLSGWLHSWLPILSQPQLHRDYYNAIAARMLPLFLDNPNLWKIILHFGDSRKWNSLDDLFEHLHSTADESYSHSLNLLSNLLFL